MTLLPVPAHRPPLVRLGQLPPFTPASLAPTWSWLTAPVHVPDPPRWLLLGFGVGLLALAVGGRKTGIRLSRPALALAGGVAALWSLS